ncbi:SDR family NAD(P)-dependent oxidoreductase [Pleomorphochaeta sp. DL1XJH-081]|uniref:SDR family NAD(P)-dependent oxidoreductase n=1 Tax=Pleomorphochaeta sp. DL1XJH-081 TaxID=3409690 RepID=UPI003BB5BC93
MHNKNNRVVVITGGAKGIGRAIAEAYGIRGYRLVILGRDATALDTCQSIFKARGFDILAFQLDVTDCEACDKIITTIVSHYGGIDILILNAGVSMRGTIKDTTVDVARKIMDTNYFGSLHMIKSSLNSIKERRGSIVFISSIMALYGLAYTSFYGASKAAIKVLSESLRCELSGSGVHIGIVHVAMTQNDPEKRLFGPDGTPISLQHRNRAASQESVAEKVVTCTDRRVAEMTLTPLGKFASFMYRHFPRIARLLTTRQSSVSKLYK